MAEHIWNFTRLFHDSIMVAIYIPQQISELLEKIFSISVSNSKKCSIKSLNSLSFWIFCGLAAGIPLHYIASSCLWAAAITSNAFLCGADLEQSWVWGDWSSTKNLKKCPKTAETPLMLSLAPITFKFVFYSPTSVCFSKDPFNSSGTGIASKTPLCVAKSSSYSTSKSAKLASYTCNHTPYIKIKLASYVHVSHASMKQAGTS